LAIANCPLPIERIPLAEKFQVSGSGLESVNSFQGGFLREHSKEADTGSVIDTEFAGTLANRIVRERERG
jgi:hypothetical protein